MTELTSNKSTDVNDVQDTPSARCSPWTLVAIPVVVGICLSLVVSFFQWLQEESTRLLFVGLDGMRWPLVIGLGCVIGIVVGVLYLRPRRRTLAYIAMTLAMVGYGVAKLVRVESYYGNRTPRLTWRWTPTAEQKIKTYLTSSTAHPRRATAQEMFLPTKQDFPAFLGELRDAHVEGIDLASDWDRSPPRLLWRHPIGLGWSSFAVVGHVAIDLEQREADECVVAYDLTSGLELWCHRETTRFKNDHGDGPRSTPTIHEGRVISMGATGVLTCLKIENGELLWKKSVFHDPDQQNLFFGMTGSPLVYDEKVLVTPGAGQGASAICYSLTTGEEIWRSGDDPAAYASPVEVSLGGHCQLLSFNGAGLRAYDLQGKPLWLHPWVTQGESRVNVAQPVVIKSCPASSPADHKAKILISSGYDCGTALLEITHRGESWEPEVIWHSKHLKSKLSNFVVYGNHIYGLDNGLLTCLDLANGRREWKRGRYGHGQLLLVGDKLLIQAESGEVVLVSASPDSHQELTRFPALASKTWNHPALAGRILVVRNDREAAAYELPIN